MVLAVVVVLAAVVAVLAAVVVASLRTQADTLKVKETHRMHHIHREILLRIIKERTCSCRLCAASRKGFGERKA